jgi:hypothetical protein
MATLAYVSRALKLKIVKISRTNLAFYCVFNPSALPNISETAVGGIIVTISSDLSGEVSQSGEGVGERDAR